MSRARTHTAAVTAAGAALLGALAGCNSSSEAAPPIVKTTRPSPSSTASPSQTASTPATPEEQAVAQAQQAVRSYWQVTDQLGVQANVDLDSLRTISTGTALNDARNQLLSQQKQGWKQVGSTRLVSMDATAVSFLNKPAQQPPQVPHVDLDVCYDVSGVNVVDTAGRSVVSAHRPDKALAKMGVVNYQWPSTQEWKVAYTTFTEKPCGTG